MKIIFCLLLITASLESVYHPSWEEAPTGKHIQPLRLESTRNKEPRLEELDKFEKNTADLAEKDLLPKSSPSQETRATLRVAILLQAFAITAFLMGLVLLGWYFLNTKIHSPLRPNP